MQSLIGSGLYPLSRAARLVGQEPRTVRRWLKGYSWKYRDGRAHSGPLWHTEYEDEDWNGERVIGFRDLLELRMVGEFVKHGVHLKIIRATIDAATQEFGTAYPLTNRRFLTDGRRIFMEAVEVVTGAEKLIDVLGRQFVFAHVVRDSLFNDIVYVDDEARRWYPYRQQQIVLDPAIQFGTPIVANAGVPTDTLHAAWFAEGRDFAAIARLYGVTPAQAGAAVRFEERLAA